ncbi:MAG: hypothetical protein ACRCX2_31965 [Paraclostridium sp.]
MENTSLLNSLKLISDSFESEQQKEFSKRIQEQEEKYNKQYSDIIENLEQRLFEEAREGKRKLYVGSFMNLDRDFNYSFNKTLLNLNIEIEVIPNMSGNLKKIYDYLKEKGLNPELEYTTDYYKEGFAIVIKW